MPFFEDSERCPEILNYTLFAHCIIAFTIVEVPQKGIEVNFDERTLKRFNLFFLVYVIHQEELQGKLIIINLRDWKSVVRNKNLSQLTVTSSKSTTEILIKGVKYVHS